jgi:hypothetical protein
MLVGSEGEGPSDLVSVNGITVCLHDLSLRLAGVLGNWEGGI